MDVGYEAAPAPGSQSMPPFSGLSHRRSRETPAAPGVRRGSSLASTDQTVTAEAREICPYSTGRTILELFSGQAYPDRCRSSRCHVCLPLNARRRTLAITLAAPERMIRLSLVAEAGDDHPCDTALVRIKRIRQALKRRGVEPGEWCFTLEENPKETGFHVHCLQKGPYVGQQQLQEACHSAGAGYPDIRRIHRRSRWVDQYGLKGFGADGYGLKHFRPSGDPMRALRINNGRVEHHSRGFFNIDGNPLRVRAAERLAISLLNEGKQVAFVGCHPDQVEKIMSNDGLRFKLIRDVNQRNATKHIGSPLISRLRDLQNT